MTVTSLAPVSGKERIATLDVARGFALLGILLVNMHSFARPFGDFVDTTIAPGTPWYDAAAKFGVAAFCTGKFYPLFSMLFGIGLAIQHSRAAMAGRPFGGVAARRLLFLGLLGLLHGLLIWYGDVLLIYSIVSVALVLCLRCRARTLAIIGAALLLWSVVLGAAMGAWQAAAAPQVGEPVAAAQTTEATPPASQETPEGSPAPPSAPAAAGPGSEPTASPFSRLLERFRDPAMQGPEDPVWIETETEAYKSTSYVEQLKFRVLSWLMVVVFTLMGFGWHIAAMMFFGAALWKAGFFGPEGIGKRRVASLTGLMIGLPGSIAAAVLDQLTQSPLATAISTAAAMLFGPALSLGYITWIGALAERGGVAADALARVGRLGLTNYLSESLLATTLMYGWGAGLFGLEPGAQVVVAIAIYAALVVWSAVYTRVLAMGPMEWIWRSVTYLKLQSLTKAAAG